MHEIAIPPEVAAAARAMRGGRDYMVDALDPMRTAHVVVDLQNGYMAPGAPLEVPVAREIVPNVNAISAAVRAAGGTNVFLRYTMRDEAEKSWSTWHRLRNSPEGLAGTREAFAEGAHHWQFWPSLEIAEDDLIIEKQRFSAFVPGTCRLDDELRARGIDTLIVSGTMTNVCCESSARDAMQRNYKVLFASDATAAWTDAAHNATLATMCMVFADVVSTAEILTLLGIAGETRAA